MHKGALLLRGRGFSLKGVGRMKKQIVIEWECESLKNHSLIQFSKDLEGIIDKHSCEKCIVEISFNQPPKDAPSANSNTLQGGRVVKMITDEKYLQNLRIFLKIANFNGLDKLKTMLIDEIKKVEDSLA